MIKNTTQRFGVVTKLLHCIVALAVFIQYFLVYRRTYIPKTSPSHLQYILLHKSIGVTLLALGTLFLFWHWVNLKPAYPITMKSWERILAGCVQKSLYYTVVIMAITGATMSLAGGKGLMWFGISLPQFIPPNQTIAGLFYITHVRLSYIVMGLVGLHILGACKHHWIDKNNVLKRMF
jgi:cytochrome b561